MAKNLEVARSIVDLSPDSEALLISKARPIVLAPVREVPEISPAISPNNTDLGVMLPYAPLHHLLFAAGAAEILVMTSANRSSEPIAYQDDEALDRLEGHSRRIPDRRTPHRTTSRRFHRKSRRLRPRDPPPLKRLRSVVGRRNSVEASNPRGRRRSEEQHHTGSQGPSLRQPAHRRLGAIPVASSHSVRPFEDLTDHV